jgi:hypothetical protein
MGQARQRRWCAVDLQKVGGNSEAQPVRFTTSPQHEQEHELGEASRAPARFRQTGERMAVALRIQRRTPHGGVVTRYSPHPDREERKHTAANGRSSLDLELDLSSDP